MPAFNEEIEIRTEKQQAVVNITSGVEEIVARSGIKEGLALVYPLHTSSAVFINDSDFSITEDFLDVARKLVPPGAGYRHDETDHKKNADGHIKSILTGHHITLPVTDGRLHLGTYQTIYYAEYDGGRKKEILVKIIGE